MSKSSGEVRSGLRLSFINTVLSGLFQFGAMMILARLLTRADYGAYAMGMAITALPVVFVTNVMERILVVSPIEEGNRDKSLAILFLCLTGSVIALVASFVIDQLSIAEVDVGVVAVQCIASAVGAMAIMPRVALRHEMRFAPIVIAEMTGLVLGQGVVAIGLAILRWGPYALAFGFALQNLAIVAVLRARASKGRLVWPTFREIDRLARNAASLGGNAATEIFNAYVPNFVLGTQLGTIPLGLFNRCYSLVQMPIQLLVSSMSRVMVSALFSTGEDRARLQSMSRSLVRVAAVMATPVAAGIAGASHNFVLFALGSKWIEAETIMPFLAIGSWGIMMGTLYGIIAEARRAFAWKTKAQLVSTGVLILLMLWGSRYSLFLAVAGSALSSCLFMLLFARLAARVVELPFLTVLSWLAPGMLVALFCLSTSFGLGQVLHNHSPLLVFAVQIAGCGLVDAGALLMLFPDLVLQIVEGMAPAALRSAPALARRLRKAAEVRGI